ncbi:MAG: TraR/DksA C4-type zinc finger protein [Bacteroidota bacterium]
MNTQTVKINRYSAADLAAFKAHIEKKLEKAERQLASLEAQIENTVEAKDSQGDWMDDSSNGNDMDMLQMMANRQQNYVIDLRNALQRIHNKSYGICAITGELIDKRRLLAVPTTTKSLAAKMGASTPVKKAFVAQNRPSAAPKIISRVIGKPTTPQSVLVDDGSDLEMEAEEMMREGIDFDAYSEEDFA